jgi:hypothetical protein
LDALSACLMDEVDAGLFAHRVADRCLATMRDDGLTYDVEVAPLTRLIYQMCALGYTDELLAFDFEDASFLLGGVLRWVTGAVEIEQGDVERGMDLFLKGLYLVRTAGDRVAIESARTVGGLVSTMPSEIVGQLVGRGLLELWPGGTSGALVGAARMSERFAAELGPRYAVDLARSVSRLGDMFRS